MMFRVLEADPAWQFGDKLPGPGRGAEKHYACMTLREICEFAIPPVADDAVLLLWRVSSMQMEALAVVEAWGFDPPTSEVVWIKTTKDGRLRMGMGRTVRNCHEICLLARRGKPERAAADVYSVVEAPELVCSVCKQPQYETPWGELTCSNGHGGAPSIALDPDADRALFEERGRHSAKPDRFYEEMARLYPGPRASLFARKRRLDWECFGLEVEG